MSEFFTRMVDLMRRSRPEPLVSCAVCAEPGWVMSVEQDQTAEILHLDQRTCRALWVYRRELEEPL